MPWCAGCDRFLSPSTVTVGGSCPRCGAPVEPGRASAPSPIPASIEAAGFSAVDQGAAGERAPDDDTLPLPWHFKLLVGAIALYLGWRAFQGIEWLVHQV